MPPRKATVGAGTTGTTGAGNVASVGIVLATGAPGLVINRGLRGLLAGLAPTRLCKCACALFTVACVRGVLFTFAIFYLCPCAPGVTRCRLISSTTVVYPCLYGDLRTRHKYILLCFL